jgi:uncharacterized protein (DUF1800 family)
VSRFPRLLLAILSIVMLSAAHAGELSSQERALHVLNRLGYGPKPGDIDKVLGMGIERYIDAQLSPDSMPLPSALTQRLATLQAANMSAGESLARFLDARQAVKQDQEEGKQKQREIYQRMTEEIGQARLVRAIDSPRQLEEVMVDFWFNHFNVFAGKGLDRALIASYERDAIRPYALGRFRELLGATAKHPAMLFYLDNWLSAAPGYQPARRAGNGPAAKASGLNENYARELMELHTLGVDGGYSQKDVTELARMLTGWTFTPRELVRKGRGFQFDERRHDWGDKEWLGHHVAPRGREEGEWALDVLAAHPATARHISFELAQYFVSDTPPPALVERLARRFLETHGDIRATLRTLFSSPEFWDAANVGNKFKTPYQYVISGVRATNMEVDNVRPLLRTLAQLGMPLYGCQTPDGYKNTEAAWLNPDALTRRINFATALASGRLPLGGPVEVRVEAEQVMNALGASISAGTRATVTQSQPALRAALVLGSPDFMRH